MNLLRKNYGNQGGSKTVSYNKLNTPISSESSHNSRINTNYEYREKAISSLSNHNTGSVFVQFISFTNPQVTRVKLCNEICLESMSHYRNSDLISKVGLNNFKYI
jgi:hypothetical protein